MVWGKVYFSFVFIFVTWSFLHVNFLFSFLLFWFLLVLFLLFLLVCGGSFSLVVLLCLFVCLFVFFVFFFGFCFYCLPWFVFVSFPFLFLAMLCSLWFFG